jgi:hypothetical protein
MVAAAPAANLLLLWSKLSNQENANLIQHLNFLFL